MSAVVLLSGGLDSATTLYLARKIGFKCFCLIFDYGQRHRNEIASAKKIARQAGCPFKILKINLPWKGSALLDKNIKIPQGVSAQGPKCASIIPSTYVPGRNIIFLSFALSYAEAIGASSIFIGAHAQDYSGYPDCRPNFFLAFNKAAIYGTKAGIENRRIKIRTPLINKKKSGIIKLGKALGVPFALTWSCYRGGSRPCGKCDSCYYRAKGFKEAGLKDPQIW
ncbi:MAG: 7-cyano-7-deazaguanine synthase QueC [Omnitrophica WOR_2 bacterium RBG_13_44_8b]|nr:MAG: 7-cyano-7-deazaguanine synthase QueC [Omnitrophica WOR_2 bacterium RBG_13_44_8b]